VCPCCNHTKMCKLFAGSWLCDDCFDSFSLPKWVEKEQKSPTTKARSERAKMNARIRFAVLERDDFSCTVCGRGPRSGDDVKLHVDHIYPIAEGGKTVKENLQTLCQDCNSGKGARIVQSLVEDLPMFTRAELR